MKKSLLKFIPVSLLMIGSFSFYSCSDDKDNDIDIEITVDDLPSAAQKFLQDYFNGYTVTKVEKDVTAGIYEVDLQDGYEVDFDLEGNWVQVEAPDGKTIPTGFIPEQVMATLNERFPDYGINEINSTGAGYKVELNDNQGGESIDVYFNMSGEITQIGEIEY